MNKMLTIQPLFIALTGARDRAKHEGSTVGCVAGRFKLEMHLGAISERKLPEDKAKQIEQLQLNALRVIEYTLQTMVDDMSCIVSGQPSTGSISLTPNFVTAVMPEDDPYMRECQRLFFEACSGDTETMDALSAVTANIVRGWQQ